MPHVKDGIYSKVKALPHNGIAVFPLDKWNAARSAASKIKSVYGVTFSVRKKDGEIIVTRTDRVPVKGESVVREDLNSLEIMEKITFDEFREWKTYATAAYNMNKDPRYTKVFCASKAGRLTVGRVV